MSDPGSGIGFQVDATLDTFGLLCPVPIIKTAKKIRELGVGQILEVLSDDEGIKDDMPAWCKSTGQEFLKIIEAGRGEYRAYVRKLVG